MLSVSITLAWGVYANWDKDANGDGQPDGFSLRVMDPSWWDSSRDSVIPVIAEARERAFEVKDRVWGQAGALDQAEADNAQAPDELRITPSNDSVLPEQPAQSQEAQPETAEPEVERRTPSLDGDGSPRRQRLEQRIANAHDVYSAGLSAYRLAQPREDGSWGEEQWSAAAEAQRSFQQVKQLLDDGQTLPDYESLPDHRPEVLSFAQKNATS